MKTVKKIDLASQDMFVVSIRNRRPWWWWLLLLLLLPLLWLKCNKDVSYQVTDKLTGEAVEGAQVDFFLIRKGDTTSSQKAVTPSSGIVTFGAVDKRLYQLIFQPQLASFSDYTAKAVATKGCYTDTFHTAPLPQVIDTLTKLPILFRTKDVQIHVRSTFNSLEPIDSAVVTLLVYYPDSIAVFDAISDSNGDVEFKRVPACADSVFAKAEKYDYAPDSTTLNMSDVNGRIVLELTSPVTVKLYKCYNSGRDHYHVFFDDKYFEYFKTTTATVDQGGADGPPYGYDVHKVLLTKGTHQLEFKLFKGFALGTCNGCTIVEIPELGFRKYFSRSPSSSNNSFTWELTVPK